MLNFELPKIRDYEGNIEKRWCIFWFIPSAQSTGRTKMRKVEWISDKIKDRKERYKIADEIITRVTKELNAGHFDIKKPEKILLITALDRALIYKQSTVNSERSSENFKYRIDDLKNWLQENKLLNLKAEQFNKFHASKFFEDVYLSNNLKSRTLNGYISYIKPIFKYIMKISELETNPFADFEKLKVKDSDLIIWSEVERKLLSTLVRDKYPEMFMVCALVFHSFLRMNEILNIQIKDIDLNHKFIKVPASKGKSNKVKFTTISNQLIEMLKTKIKNPENFYLISDKMQAGPRRLNRSYLSKKFAKIRKELNLPEGLILYNLKHTGNSLMLDKGASMQELREQNGHQETRTTEIYARRLFIKANDRFINQDDL